MGHLLPILFFTRRDFFFLAGPFLAGFRFGAAFFFALFGARDFGALLYFIFSSF
jgi:hypothetical protein